MASLHKDPRKKSPFWYCAFTTRDEAGKMVRHFKSTKTQDKKEAVQICNTWSRASTFGVKMTPDKARDVITRGVQDVLMASGQTLPSATIGVWCKRWLEIKSLEAEPRTLERYESSICHFLDFLGDKANTDLNDLKVDSVLKFRDHLAKRLSPASTNLELKILRACLYAAQKQDLIERNVASKVDTLKQAGENKRRGFTLAEVQKVLKQCDETGGEWRGLVLAGLYTGQRR
jgi:Phage integrase SAM-like domain